MGLLILAILMFITNLLGVYFTFNTWYEKKVGDVPVTVDDLGRIEIDEEKMRKDAIN